MNPRSLDWQKGELPCTGCGHCLCAVRVVRGRLDEGLFGFPTQAWPALHPKGTFAALYSSLSFERKGWSCLSFHLDRCPAIFLKSEKPKISYLPCSGRAMWERGQL